MTINGTLVVQAINFGVAYLLLRILLFKPAVAAIQAEHSTEKVLRNAITGKHVLIKQKKEQQFEQLLQCHQFFIQNRPEIDGEDRFVFRRITPSMEQVRLDEQELHLLTNQVSAAVVQRVKHVA